MKTYFVIFLVTLFFEVQCKYKINVEELRCLVCEAALDEFDNVVQKIDPAKRIEVGGYRLDNSGNLKQETVSQAKSEVYLSELADTICDKMDDYVRATWKSNGQLTILRLIDSNGKMNSDMSEVDIIQDDDLNKSLKYYCEGILEEFEESIIKHYKNNSDNIDIRVCSQEAGLCSHSLPEPDGQINEEL